MKHYKMMDVVSEISERVNSPSTSGYNRFVGLEHYVSGEVEITHYGSTTNLDSAMKVFRSGDILVARRNVYLKRASVVFFDGLTSGDSIVLRAKNDRMARLLPFVLNTDAFWDYADQYSDGTMSKRLSPKTLMQYEFDLPDEDQQDYLADTLWAAAMTKASYQHLLTQIDELIKSQFIEMFGDPIENPKGWPASSLLELGDCKNGMNFHSKDHGFEINCLGVGDFKDLAMIDETSELPMVSLNEMPPVDYLLHDGDIVFVRSNGNKDLVGRCLVVYPHDVPTTFSGFCIRFRKTSANVKTEYLLRFLKMDSVRKKMAGRGANIQNLNQQILSALQVPVPPIVLQDQYGVFVEQANKLKCELKQAIESVGNLIKLLMQQDFSNSEKEGM